MIRKGITYLLAVVFSFSLLIVNASAVNSSESEELISEEIAEIIADCFIRDFQSMPDSIWTESTAVYDSKALYDQDGNVSAYSFELMTEGETTGYVVVSAYPDVQNKILEFSETAEPLYDKWNLSSGDKVVYTGGLNYYREKQDGSLLTIDGLSVSKEEIPTPLVDCRDASYLPIQTFAVIEDPIDWAETYYGGTFEAVEWKNAFETSCRYRRTQDFSGYYNHCGPTAITNLVELVGWYRSYTPVTSKTGTEIFTEIAKYGMKKGYFLNSNDIFGTTYFSSAGTYLKESFALFDISTSVTTYSSVTYSRVKTAIDAYKPFLLALENHDTYNDHFVAGYAYTKLKNASGTTLSFIKIADGWYHSGRYIALSMSGLREMHVVTVGTLG